MTLKSIKAFTVLELMIVAILIAILGLAIIITLNPSELIAEGRDGQREENTYYLTKAVEFSSLSGRQMFFGLIDTVYISIPYAEPDCGYSSGNPLDLPLLPSGWNYHCASKENYRKTDGLGWVPVNMMTETNEFQLSSLPIDPLNDASDSFYYSYYSDGGKGFEINTKIESSKYSLAGMIDRTSTDGGDDMTRLEKGNDLTIAPWSFEFKNMPIMPAANGKPGWYSPDRSNPPVIVREETGTDYIRFNSFARFDWQENIPFNPNSTYKMTCRYRQVTDPTDGGGKEFFCGYLGVSLNRVTLVNINGDNSPYEQHYHTTAGNSLPSGSPFTEIIGFTHGKTLVGSSGDYGPCHSPYFPCKMRANVFYIKPMFIVNYGEGQNDGTADIDSIKIEKF